MSNTVTLRINAPNATHDLRMYSFYRDLVFNDRDYLIAIMRASNLTPHNVHTVFSVQMPILYKQNSYDNNVDILFNVLTGGERKKSFTEHVVTVHINALPPNLRWRTVEDCRYCSQQERNHVQTRGHDYPIHTYARPTRDQIHMRMRTRLFKLRTDLDDVSTFNTITHKRSRALDVDDFFN